MEFKSGTKTDVSWMVEELCLALTVVDEEIKNIRSCFVGCDVKLNIGGRVFTEIDENMIEFLLVNNLTRLSIEADVEIRDHQASVVRYVRDKGASTDFDALYNECIRDTRS